MELAGATHGLEDWTCPDLLLTMLGDPSDEASLLPVRQRRLDGASLLRRTFDIDAITD